MSVSDSPTDPVEKTWPIIIRKPFLILIIAIWFALLTGLVEALIWGVRKLAGQEIILLSPHLVWMAPLVYILLYLPIGIFFLLVARRFRSLISLRLITFVYSLISFLSLLLMFGFLQRTAVMLLALGLAVQTSYLVSKHTALFLKLIRATMGWLRLGSGGGERSHSSEAAADPPVPLPGRRQFLFSAGATLAGLAIGVNGWETIDEQRRFSKLPTAVPDLPNVLLIVLDTVRAQSLSLYGYARATTPYLERFAQRGVRFDSALATSPYTLPSHASMFTGRFPHELSTSWEIPLDTTYPTLAEALSSQGYITAGFVANTSYCSYEFGLNRGFVHYEDYPISLGQTFLSASPGRTLASSDKLRKASNYHEVLNRKSATRINADFLNWLSGQDQRPFFAFLNYFDAHEPYLPPAPFDTMFGPGRRPGADYFHMPHLAARRSPWQMTAQEIQTELDAYDGAIASLDHRIGDLLDQLEKQGILNNTLVIVTSDHGEQFGEKRLFGHGNSLYRQCIEVPLLVTFPGRVPANAEVKEPVSLRDVPKTVFDLIGATNRADFPGRSLARLWDGSEADAASAIPVFSTVEGRDGQPAWYPISKGTVESLVFNGMHYIRNGDGSEELYNFDDDPLEERNLAGEANNRHVLQQLRATTDELLKS